MSYDMEIFLNKLKISKAISKEICKLSIEGGSIEQINTFNHPGVEFTSDKNLTKDLRNQVKKSFRKMKDEKNAHRSSQLA